MPLTPLPALDRTSPTFKTDLDAYFLTALPTFSTEANTLQTDVTAKQMLASAAAVTAQAAIDAGLANAATSATTATTQAGIATTKAGEALSSANAAAASVASIAGGPVASVNGRTGVVTGVQDSLVSGTTLKTVNGATLLGSGDLVVGGTGTGTLSNVTGSRALGTTYTNSGATTRWVSVAVYNTTSPMMISCDADVAGINGAFRGPYFYVASGTALTSIHFPVTPGQTYRVLAGNIAIQQWVEFQ